MPMDSLTFLYNLYIVNSEGSSKSTGILNSFTKQTNTLDVDKHMMKYIEEEMRKRNGVSAEDEEEKAQETRGGDTDIYDELGIRVGELVLRLHHESTCRHKTDPLNIIAFCPTIENCTQARAGRKCSVVDNHVDCHP